MRGKYGKAAEVRRDWGAVTIRAETAEKRAVSAELELGELRARHVALEATYRQEVRALKAERDEAVSAKLRSAESRASQLHVELATLKTESTRRWMRNNRVIEVLLYLLVDVGERWGCVCEVVAEVNPLLIKAGASEVTQADHDCGTSQRKSRRLIKRLDPL